MPLLTERDRHVLEQTFAEALREEVQIVYFTQRESALQLPSHECLSCRETRELLEELSGVSDKVHLQVHDFVANGDLAKRYSVDKIPATVLLDAAGGRIRFFGEPSGYEFATLVEDIVDVSRGTTRLNERTKEELRGLAKPTHLQVFVTPT